MRRNHGARCNKTAGYCSLQMLSVPSFSRPQKNSLARLGSARFHEVRRLTDERAFATALSNRIKIGENIDRAKRKKKKTTTQSRGMKRPFCPLSSFYSRGTKPAERVQEKLSYIHGNMEDEGEQRRKSRDSLPSSGGNRHFLERRDVTQPRKLHRGWNDRFSIERSRSRWCER